MTKLKMWAIVEYHPEIDVPDNVLCYCEDLVKAEKVRQALKAVGAFGYEIAERNVIAETILRLED